MSSFLTAAIVGITLAFGCADNAPAGDSTPADPRLEAPAHVPATDKETNQDAQSDESTTGSPSADALLSRIEAAADDLHTFTADVRYDKYDAAYDRREIRLGRIVYDMSDPKSRQIAVHITELRAPTQDELNVRYVFSGSWLVEADADDKRFEKRQIVAPGETFDPLKLGEGPLPLPIGQKKAEVLRRFDVESVALPDTLPLKNLQNVDGIRLIPRPDTPEAEEFHHVDLYYDRDTMLPVGIELVSAKLIDPGDESSRDRKTIRLTNLQRNVELSESDRALLSIDTPDPKQNWRVVVKPWRGER